MNEIVWIFGTSAVGKQTFIKRVLADKRLAARLGQLSSDFDITVLKSSENKNYELMS